MSSHHFVREGQEPALFIAEIVPFAAAEGLLEWSPKVLAGINALDLALSWGIKVDVVFTDSISEADQMLQGAFPIDIVPVPNGESMLATGLNYLSGKNEKAVNVLTADPIQSRQIAENYADEMNVVLWSDYAKWTFHAKPFQKWLMKGSGFYLYKTQREQHFKVDGAILSQSDYTVENDGIIQIFSDFPYWVVEKQIF